VILEDFDVHAGNQRSYIIHLANVMSARRWKLYQQTHDERHATLAEWWQQQAANAIGRIQ
jgi:protein subunit release factor B